MAWDVSRSTDKFLRAGTSVAPVDSPGNATRGALRQARNRDTRAGYCYLLMMSGPAEAIVWRRRAERCAGTPARYVHIVGGLCGRALEGECTLMRCIQQ